MKRVIVVQHIGCEGLGLLAEVLAEAQVASVYLRGYAGDPVPKRLAGVSGLIVLGGPMGVRDAETLPFLAAELALIEQTLADGLPILGICLGSQLLASMLGSQVRRGRRPEIGWHPIAFTDAAATDPLSRDLPPAIEAFHWHGDIFEVPSGARLLAVSDEAPCQIFSLGDRVCGLLCHLEATAAGIAQLVGQFPEDVAAAGLTAAAVLGPVERHLPPLQAVGRQLFRRWVATLPPV